MPTSKLKDTDVSWKIDRAVTVCMEARRTFPEASVSPQCSLILMASELELTELTHGRINVGLEACEAAHAHQDIHSTIWATQTQPCTISGNIKSRHKVSLRGSMVPQPAFKNDFFQCYSMLQEA